MENVVRLIRMNSIRSILSIYGIGLVRKVSDDYGYVLFSNEYQKVISETHIVSKDNFFEFI